MVPAQYGYYFKLFDFFRSCKILFGLVKFKTAPDRMSGNVWEVFVNTELNALALLQENEVTPAGVWDYKVRNSTTSNK